MATTEPLSRAYLLHARPYRESSLLLDLLDEEHGRIAAVARVGGRQGQAKKAQLQPFRPLLVGLSGHSSLRTLSQLDAPSLPLPLTGEALFAGLYLNELCQRLLAERVPLDGLFDHYHQALVELAQEQPLAPVLRRFERQLLQQLGHLPTLHCDAAGVELHPQQLYAWQPGQGLVATANQGYLGAALLNWQAERLDDPDQLRQIKHLVRQLLAPLLGRKPLHSRTLFQKQRGRHEHSSGR
ncbi:DNA repair protein RecO [Ferrimonas marina]|uniref:DNA repair protein RecO n=1 Tax=Ferrimonas marina TaxID=299255 RepID=A0A1M5ZGJ4_9GAMM|nr:DNA repair protein RecO [Ferrimonas marina]SHI23318.1 DNA replication and repair protein RecO [Ferrimonas marina]